MAGSVPASVTELKFEIARPSDLSARRWDEIQELRRAYYARVFDQRTDGELDYFLGQTTIESWDDPNNSALRGRYARARVVAAYDRRDGLVAYGYSADNASSTRPSVFGEAEKFAKLHVPISRFQEKRYQWIREMVHDDKERPYLHAAIGAALISASLPTQPVTQYLYEEETDQRQVLQEWGFIPQADLAEVIHPFGEDAQPTNQRRYQAVSVTSALAHMMDTQPAALAARHILGTAIGSR